MTSGVQSGLIGVDAMTEAPPAAGDAQPAPSMPVFYRLLVNTLLSGVTSSFLWFALTFWVYVETKSVVATGMIGGAYSLCAAVLGPVFGTFVDRHRKHSVMMLATITTTLSFTAATAVYVGVDNDSLLDLSQPWFWLLVGLTLFGSVAAMMRSIALSTCVTLLVPDNRRDRANGMVGTVTGVSFAITSVFSGLIIGMLGMGWAYGSALVLTVASLAHLATIVIPEPQPERPAGDTPKYVDIRGAIGAIAAVPGLFLVIALTAFNNLLAGVFMALTDAYGLSLVDVETWGLLWGFISLAFIAGGLVVARFGLGRNPLRILIAGNIVNWAICVVFPLRSSIVLLTAGMVVWLALIPAIEAAEQTVLQRSIPFDRQGRVFGFAQLVENAAAPITAFLMAPLAEAVFIPAMTDGRGADWIGSWFGTGPDRGLAIMFVLAGVIGVVMTVAVAMSRSFRRLSAAQVGAAAT
jgi:DHA3 family multidrug efflux protein-like MFS transporter